MTDAPLAAAGPAFDGFLSYARADDPSFRDALVSGLVREGLRIWFDRESLPNRGTTFGQEIRRAIESSARLVLVVGPGALASEWVAQEWGYADDLGLPVVPVLRAGGFDDLPDRLRSYQSVDARPTQTVDAVVSDLARLLSEPVQPLGTCYQVPRQPPHALSRPDLLEQLWLALGLDRQRPEEAGRAPRGAALYGISGVGKSTVAAAFARSTRSRRVFSDGIVWLSCRPPFQPLAGARQVLEQVAVGAKPPDSEDQIETALTQGLAGREILVVLDDVRDPKVAKPYLDALGPGGRLLLTVLDKAIATELGAVDIAVDQLDEAAARQLPGGWAGGPLPPQAEAVLVACDGLPFALAIVGAMVLNQVPWTLVAQLLEGRQFDQLKAPYHPSLLRVLAASYDALAAEDPRAAACYLELAAFRPGAALTESAMVRLWSRSRRMTRLEASLVLPVLERRLLLDRQPPPHDDHFVLHTLQEDFIRIECANTAELEAELVASYRAEKGTADWSTLTDDGYIYDNLVAHLAALGERAELITAVNAEWVRRQLLRRGDLGQALDDVRVALAAAAPPLDLPAVAGLSLLSGQVAATLREAPPNLVGAMAEAGEVDQALRWAADKPDPAQRFEALVVVADVLLGRGEVMRARRVVQSAAVTIPLLGGVVETGMFSGLTALNAVHALVSFPYPDQWEGTTDEQVALAQIPLDALVRLAPVAAGAGAVAALATVSHPYWELYGHLIPLVAVEQLADQGDRDVAAALLDERDVDIGDDDPAHAARYRHAVASAALGRFDQARAAVEALPESYRAVGYRGLARHLAAAGRVDDALELIGLIDDATVADQATEDLVEAAIERAESDSCRRVAQFVLDRDWGVAGAWLLAAGGDPSLGLQLLDRTDRDDLGLGLGVRLGHILHQRGNGDEATAIARRLVPMAARLLGPQWFAPEATSAEPALASLGRGLLSLLARTGEPLPDGVTPLALIVEGELEEVPGFKLELIIDLVTAGRFAEARELADTSSPLAYAHALGLATALSVADPSVPAGDLRHAASSLAEALNGIESDSMLDVALGAAMRALVSAGLHEEARGLVERLLRRPGLWSAIGVWALDRARTGRGGDVRQLMRRLLIERPLSVPDARARAMVLAAVAARRSAPGDELDAAAALLAADLAAAAGALDVVFEVVDLYARQRGLDAAGNLARSLPEGVAATLSEELMDRPSITWDHGPSFEEVAAATAVRAVAAAGMVLATSHDGSRRRTRTWLKRAEALADLAERIAPGRGAAAIAKYLGAARAEVTKAHATAEEEEILMIAWLLWDRGRFPEAVRYAKRSLGELGDLFSGPPQVEFVDDLERRGGVLAASRAGLGAIVAIDAAARGDLREAKGMARAAAAETTSYGWLALNPAEQAEIHACLAIALRRAGEDEAAGEHLGEAIDPAAMLARRGELAPFQRLCQAIVEVLPGDEATLLWAEWLLVAAEAGAYEALGLIAAYVRCLSKEDLASVVVDPQTGQLHSRP
jgi:tetratricopeptide (TPR) repeat protein